MDYLVPEIQSYHFDMGSFSGKGEVDPETHYRELYGGVSEVNNLVVLLLCHYANMSVIFSSTLELMILELLIIGSVESKDTVWKLK